MTARHALSLMIVLLGFCAVCDSTTPKAGMCPSPSDGGVGLCVHTCKNDSFCPGAQKCCKTACGGIMCMSPVKASPPPSTSSAAPATRPPLKPKSTPPAKWTPSTKPTSAKGCLLPNNNIVPHGAKFEKNGGCTWCKCLNGVPSCSDVPSCRPSTSPSTVAATPSKSRFCTPGKVFQQNPCTTCTCRLDKYNNTVSDCYSIACAFPNCLPGTRLAILPDKCCPTCIPTDAPTLTSVDPTCLYNGMVFASGQTFRSSDGCNQCSCLNGHVGCTKRACVSPCAVMLCKPGYQCVEQQVQCIKSPCNPIGQCVPIPTPSVSTTGKPTCPLINCPNLMYCQYGYAMAADGCFTCSCKVAPTAGPTIAMCPLPNCVACSYGYAIDSDSGCRGCQCMPKPSSLCAFSDFQQCYQNNDVVSNLLLDPSRITATLPGNVCQALKNVLQCHRNKLGSLSVSGCSSVLKGRLSYNTKVVNKILSNFCSQTRCLVGGVSYKVNDTYLSSDGCNTCHCMESGLSACTEMACVTPGCRYGDQSYNSGDDFAALDGCNRCSCTKNVVTCSRSKCETTRYVRGQVVFDRNIDSIIPDDTVKESFRKQFRAELARKMDMSEAQITVLSVERGSIIVTFAVESSNIQDATDQLKQLIESEELIITFDDQELVASNLDYSTEEQVGSLPGEDEDEDGGSNVGLIVGVVCACVAVAVVVGIAVFIGTRKKRNNKCAYNKHMESKVSVET
ncbi:cysteine-rich motor neuron 1 protein-like [Oscarella lobularis]|uniref:cysteine-rich motor neuron 1 protein-like n=1 Tax=Oscarella lobularis TaxID=121494 RepID=UPI003313B30A